MTATLGWGVTLMLTVPLHVTFARKGKVATPIKSLFMWGPKTTGRSTLSQIDNEEKFRISHLVCAVLFLFGFLIIKTPTCVNLEPVGSHGGLCINSSPETRKLSHFEHQWLLNIYYIYYHYLFWTVTIRMKWKYMRLVFIIDDNIHLNVRGLRHDKYDDSVVFLIFNDDNIWYIWYIWYDACPCPTCTRGHH